MKKGERADDPRNPKNGLDVWRRTLRETGDHTLANLAEKRAAHAAHKEEHARKRHTKQRRSSGGRGR